MSTCVSTRTETTEHSDVMATSLYLHIEVGSGGRPHGVDMSLTFHVVVDEPPLLQEAMHTQNGSHITCQVSTATGD